MIIYPIFSNFCKKISTAMFSALHYYLLHYECCVFFYWQFLVYFHVNRKMKFKKGNTRMEFKYFLAWANEWFVWHEGCIDFKKNWGEFNVVVFIARGISLGKGFWAVNTWPALVRKRLKRSTLNFAHTFLTGR